MVENSGRYWLVGAALTALGVLSSWLSPSGAVLAGVGAATVSSAASTAGSGKSEVGSGDAGSKPPDPCTRGQELIDEYAALYGGGSKLDESGKPVWGRADYLLALVPDPELLGRSDAFAATLDGVEEAVALERVVRDREWLPWGSDASSKCAERAPGVLLFRPLEPKLRPPLVVLLVGETPTWGVREAQLKAALDRIPADEPTPLKVLGPTFSGTAASLVAALEPRKEAFQLISGTATSPTLKDLFRPPLSFSATVPNDTVLLNAMLAYLRARGGVADRIAILSEGGTTYGNSALTEAKKPDSAPEPPIELRFPVDLNPLRKAVAAAPAASAPGATGESASLPPVDPNVLVLDEVARQLSAQRVRFVGVVATDPGDVILLTSRLRSKIPDARFFTLGNDIRFTDPTLVGALNGMLVAHGATPSDFDEGTFQRSISLKSEVVRNVYLAGRALFGHTRSPPVARISLIGNGALWEIGDDHPHYEPPNSWRAVMHATWLLCVAILLLLIWPWLARSPLGRLMFRRHRGPALLSVSSCERADLQPDDALVNAALLSVVAGAALLMIVAEYAHQHAVLCGLAAGLVLVGCWSRVLWLLIERRFGKPQPFALLCSLLSFCASSFALGIGCGQPHEATLNLLSGGSGVLAGLIGFSMLGVGLWCWRARLRLLDSHRFCGSALAAEPPLAEAFGEAQGRGKGLRGTEKQLLQVIHSPWRALPIVPIAVHALLLLSVLLVYSVRAPAAFEPGWRNGLVIGFGLLSLLPITVNFSRIVATWLVLNRLLKYLALFPILEPLRKLPKKLVRNLEQQLTVPNADLTDFGPPIEQLLRIAAPNRPLLDTAESVESAWHAALREQSGSFEVSRSRPIGEIMDSLLEAASELPQNDPDADAYRALLVAIFIPRYVRHFRLYVVPVLVGSVLGVLMTSLYFVQPQRLISTVIFIWVAGMVLGAFLVYSALDRSAVISAIGNTTEGSVDFDWTLVSRILSWGLVPVLSLFAAQNPNFSNWVSVLINAFAKNLR